MDRLTGLIAPIRIQEISSRTACVIESALREKALTHRFRICEHPNRSIFPTI
jgi:hypothetical protein